MTTVSAGTGVGNASPSQPTQNTADKSSFQSAMYAICSGLGGQVYNLSSQLLSTTTAKLQTVSEQLWKMAQVYVVLCKVSIQVVMLIARLAIGKGEGILCKPNFPKELPSRTLDPTIPRLASALPSTSSSSSTSSTSSCHQPSGFLDRIITIAKTIIMTLETVIIKFTINIASKLYKNAIKPVALKLYEFVGPFAKFLIKCLAALALIFINIRLLTGFVKTILNCYQGNTTTPQSPL